MNETIPIQEYSNNQQKTKELCGHKIVPEVEKIISKNDYLINALSDICDYDKQTFNHTLKMANYSLEVSRQAELSEEETELLISSVLVHDVGKIKIDSDIIRKTEKLTDEEYEKIKKHVRAGIEYLKKANAPHKIIAIMSGHHEHQGVKSYPRGKDLGIEARQNEIDNPKREEKSAVVKKLERILAIVDHFEAATDNRPEKAAQPLEKCRREMLEKFNKEEDKQIIEILIKNFELMKL
ncbi:hypothetical protein A2331_03115 [Candidatus Falkowbacteria bacterium RIFOXYB2_FULL_34_18]|uniref:HD-GYP domain-containing protein n=1 Tax=Candidatus Falkowbacteria bacterium RIFOXYD2_FULL_34_120 TaxID=1798007 RepID=A0A1F5TMV9_9BACT|nr:MAG: hypothetical protein A2500_00085 [Candidatus Falkowbacteria bacterium RIFOXYC12_FULL_34_55]OGF28622.1 MAG: hypothetical protein A2331_03115 [Candidatus Falkowbacteria bacterium RIFOXYB2_FULL_34_18]OGF38184.1 MAG: hypothetical protein A2466_00010 [Candidatus Falkowbacteria bacterium RIFOXYC2_FULL_34_220]OGF38294.1 MAG: hypothetical protein A2515_00755 [Candidatus Falkowbacteria bacterium RIFOXYD12_FULL_34_57]OGF40283.1 MAG: hypothetical protein A2531_04600 [Candidatus Falkowbacteria bact